MVTSSADQRSGVPAVDERLVAPESGYEIIDGKVVAVPGADEPHGRRHSKVNAVLEAHVTDEYDVACDMLTRTSKTNDFAPDASVYPVARDPQTGGRQIEELAFEVVSTQTLSNAATKARQLCARGVRRIFAADVQRERVLEWSAGADSWGILPEDGHIEDPCFAVALPVEALVKAAKSDDAVARALLAKRNRVLREALDDSRNEGVELGRKEGVEAMRSVLLAVFDSRGWSLSVAQRERIQACTDTARLRDWATKAIEGSSADAVFDRGDA
jgi:hypothetical protein